jgi:hypothetical protein
MGSESKREIVHALSFSFDKNAAPQYAEAALFQELRSVLDLAYLQLLKLNEFKRIFQLRLSGLGAPTSLFLASSGYCSLSSRDHNSIWFAGTVVALISRVFATWLDFGIEQYGTVAQVPNVIC